jgi:hypothetical protein
MPTDPKNDIDMFLSLARQKKAAIPRVPESKLEPHREVIMAAVNENLPITAIRAVLAEHRGLKTSYTNLRLWIRRQQQAS